MLFLQVIVIGHRRQEVRTIRLRTSPYCQVVVKQALTNCAVPNFSNDLSSRLQAVYQHEYFMYGLLGIKEANWAFG